MLRLRAQKRGDLTDTRYMTSGRLVRLTYGAIVIATLIFMVYWVARPLFFLEGPGVVHAPSINISLPFPARVESVSVKPGQRIELGVPLAVASRVGAKEAEWEIAEKLHEARRKRTEFEARLMIANRITPETEKRVAIARQSVDLILGQKRQITNSFELSSLYREYAEAINQAAAAEADLKLMPGAITELGEEIRSLEERRSSLESSWRHIVIAAPKSGHIGATTVVEGSSVAAGATLMALFDSEAKYIVWRLPAFSLSLPTTGSEVTVSYGRHHLEGVVRRVLSVADSPTNHELGSSGRLVEVDIKDKEHLLPLGADVNVRLHYF